LLQAEASRSGSCTVVDLAKPAKAANQVDQAKQAQISVSNMISLSHRTLKCKPPPYFGDLGKMLKLWIEGFAGGVGQHF
jgi:hypothetical protein